MAEWHMLTPAQKEAARLMAWRSLEGFTRVMFRYQLGIKFKTNWHHSMTCEALEDVYFGKRKRLIINFSPGGTKTELVSIHFIAWTILREYEESREIKRAEGLSMPVSTRSLAVSYSAALTKLNTGRIKEIVLSEPFQYMVPSMLGPTRKSENDWRVKDAEGGRHEVYGVSLDGQVTGRRAGYMRPGFSGVIVIDDPMPPKDMGSFARKDDINSKLNRVVRSRLNHDDVPIVMIQQRITTGDQTDFLRSSKSIDDYELIKIPAMITPEYAKSLAPKVRAAMATATGYNGKDPVSYWEDQIPLATLKRIQTADPFLFSSQYQQAPDEAMLEGVIFRREIAEAIVDKRVGRFRIDTSIPVNSIWDIGVNDMMTLWLYQKIGPRRRFIGCYGNSELPLEHYLHWMTDYREKFGIRYGEHRGPHDLAQRGRLTAIRDIDVARQAGINFILVERPKTKDVPIQATRRIFRQIEIDEELCSMDAVDPNEKQKDRWGYAALKKFRRVWDAENEVFLREPVHDWTSHWADSFMLEGLTYTDDVPQEEVGPRITSGFSM